MQADVLLVDITAAYNELATIFPEHNNYFHLKTYFKNFLCILRSSCFSLPPMEKSQCLRQKNTNNQPNRRLYCGDYGLKYEYVFKVIFKNCFVGIKINSSCPIFVNPVREIKEKRSQLPHAMHERGVPSYPYSVIISEAISCYKDIIRPLSIQHTLTLYTDTFMQTYLILLCVIEDGIFLISVFKIRFDVTDIHL